jgi:glycine cleavage system H protein
MTDIERLRYTRTHEWVRVGDDDLLWVGITDTAQKLLGDVVFVGDVKTGQFVRSGEPVGVIESVKAAFDVYAPVDGEIVAFNEHLDSRPELLNSSPFDAWIYKMKSVSSLDDLLDVAAYQSFASTAA